MIEKTEVTFLRHKKNKRRERGGVNKVGDEKVQVKHGNRRQQKGDDQPNIVKTRLKNQNSPANKIKHG